MRQFLATVSDTGAPLAGALVAASLLNPIAMVDAFPDSLQPAAPEAGESPAATCDAQDIVVQPQSPVLEMPCATQPRTSTEIAEARAYVLETAKPGYTMTRQGPELAIERLHPEFVVRLASAIRQARDEGLPFAGIFSAYRPPAFGVGGFADKFNSLHTYGLAVDMYGIGQPGSPGAQHWHEIAAKHGIVCPYGYLNRTEWNHCQPTRLKVVLPDNRLRETVTAEGPLSLEDMFAAGDSVIASAADAADSIVAYSRVPAVDAHETSVQGSTVHVLVRTVRTKDKAEYNSRLAADLGGVKSARLSGKNRAARADGGIAAEGQRKRKSGHRSASADVKRHSTS